LLPVLQLLQSGSPQGLLALQGSLPGLLPELFPEPLLGLGCGVFADGSPGAGSFACDPVAGGLPGLVLPGELS